MAGDYSRIAEGLHRHFTTVLMQQGKVHLDSDWNTGAALTLRRLQTQADDTFGPAAVPAQTTPDGFKLTPTTTGGAPDFAIGVGRCYVDGIQAELYTGETVGGNPVTYLNQPFYPTPDPIPTAGLAYLDVWQREVTYIEDPTLLDVALGGVDTTTRVQTVWQVKLTGPGANQSPPPDCSTDLNGLFPASAGILSSQAVAPVAPDDPCILPDQGGYRGVENRLYRVQIHDAPTPATTRWKWSRENASVVSRVTAIATAAASTLTVDRIGRDAVLRFAANDWVEITDDHNELMGLPGTMAQIASPPNETSRTIVLDRVLPANFDATDPTRHTRIIRWDQQTGLDGDGLLTVASGFVELEDGVQVSLAIDTSKPGGAFHVGDYWCMAARTADSSVEPLTNAPPLGLRHHYCPLATFTLSGGTLTMTGDCRVLWPPAATAGTDCCCIVCVEAPAHNAGTATIAMAVETARQGGGGRICLGPGQFNLTDMLVLNGLQNVALSGQGPATELVSQGGGIAMLVESSVGITIEDLAVVSLTTTGGLVPSATATVGIALRNVLECTVERVGVGVVVGSPTPQSGFAASTKLRAALTNEATPAASDVQIVINSMAIALDGLLVEVSVLDCVLVADAGIGKLALIGNAANSDASFLAKQDIALLAGLRIERNLLLDALLGVAIVDTTGTATKEDSRSFTIAALETSITDNRAIGTAAAGIAVSGFAINGAAIRIERNHLETEGLGIVAAIDAATIADNHVTALDLVATQSASEHAKTLTPTPGVMVLSPPYGSAVLGEVRVLRNRIDGIFGAGIAVEALALALSISENAIAATVGAGIITGTGSGFANLVLRGNEVYAVVGPSADGTSPVCGIDIGGALDAVVQANIISGIASTGAMSAGAGIRLRAVGNAAIDSNDITGIGQPNDTNDRAIGILFDSGFNDAMVRSNSVRQALPAETTAAAFTCLLATAGNTKTQPSISVLDNVFAGASVLSLVQVAQAQDCIFTANRCLLSTATSASGLSGAVPVVALQGETVIAGDNRVSRPAGGTLAGGNENAPTQPVVLAVTAAYNQAQQIQATVLGNIVSGGIIWINDAALEAPWLPLNIQS